MATKEEHDEARRKNGRKSRGPKTVEGRARTDHSKITHGIKFQKPVIPNVESSAEWETHHRAFINDLMPVGSLEGAFVYRIALSFWRLNRIVRAETATISLNLENDWPLSDNGSGSVERAREALGLFKWWIEAGDDESIDQQDAQTLLSAWPYEYGDDEVYDKQEWTCGALRQVFAQYAQQDDKTPEAVLKELRGALQNAIKTASAEVRSEQIKAGQEVSRNLLLNEDTLGRFVDYERHIAGLLRRDLSSLERLQALRTGRPVVAPLELGVTLSNAARTELG